MKKILIALLAMAMLFSFAACDNSSNTPDEPDDPTIVDPTTGAYVGEDVEGAVKTLFSIATSGDEVGFDSKGFEASVKDLLGAVDGSVDILATAAWSTDHDKYAVEVSADYKTLTVTKAISAASANGTYPEQEAAIEVRGFVTTDDAAGTVGDPIKVRFNDFTYSYKTYMTNKAGEIVPVVGSIDGYFVNTLEATVVTDADGKATSYKVNVYDSATFDIVLDSEVDTFKLAIANSNVPSAMVFDVVGKDRVGAGFTHATYKTEKEKAAKDDIAEYVTALLANDDNKSSLFAILSTEYGKLNATDKAAFLVYDGTGAGKFTITAKLSEDVNLVGDGSTSATVVLPKGETLTIVVEGTGKAEEAKFTPATMTITATKLNTNSAADNTIESIVIADGLKVAVAGTAADGTMSVTTNVPTITDLKIGDTAVAANIDGNVTSSVAYGPAVEQNSSTLAVTLCKNTVTKAY